jgi:hypothetical protein
LKYGEHVVGLILVSPLYQTSSWIKWNNNKVWFVKNLYLTFMKIQVVTHYRFQLVRYLFTTKEKLTAPSKFLIASFTLVSKLKIKNPKPLDLLIS